MESAIIITERFAARSFACRALLAAKDYNNLCNMDNRESRKKFACSRAWIRTLPLTLSLFDQLSQLYTHTHINLLANI